MTSSLRRTTLRLLLVIAAELIGSLSMASAQPGSVTADTTRAADTTGIGRDSIVVPAGGRSGVDTVIVYNAQDSIVFDIKARKMMLYGKAELTKGSMKLLAHYIEVDFETQELYARAGFDSATGTPYDVPLFKDDREEFSTLTLRYNFGTRRGTLSAAETKFDEGFYYGERIKQVDENTLFVQKGVYTTCDAPHPHYFFSSDRMKVEVQDKVFAESPTLNVADVPIFFIPIGLFFANRSGRQSGLIIPSWDQTAARGFTIEGLGYFWAINDYLDATILTNLYSKGGFTVHPTVRFRYRGVIELSDLDFTYGQTRDDPDDPLTSSFILGYNHQQQIGRRGNLGGNLRFSSQNAYRRTYPDADRFDRPDDITTRKITSNLSYSTSWPWGGTFSAGYSRSQDIVTNEIDEETLPVISFALPTWTPFASSSGEAGIFDNLSFSFSTTGRRQFIRRGVLPGGGFRISDHQSGISYSPRVSISPKLGYFTVQPSFDYSGSIFFRRRIKQADGDTIRTTEVPGLHHTFSYGVGLTLATKLYGIVQPRIFGINAIRHIVEPSITAQYRPDFGDPRYGFYDTFFNPITNRVEQYSFFEADQGVASVPGRQEQQLFTLSLRNTFEAKIAQGDTVEDRRVRLLALNLNASYNAAPGIDFRWSEISLNASTELGQIGSLSGQASFDLYDIDTLGVRIPQLLSEREKGLLRVTRAGLSFSTSFSDEGFNAGPITAAPIDSVGSRRSRFDFSPIPFNDDEFYGERVSGRGTFRMPWQISLNGNYNISPSITEIGEFDQFFNLNLGLSFSLTPTTKISTSASYSVTEGKFLVPTISFYKDLHCWEMEFDWRPSGFGTGFYFRLGIKSAQLQDIQLERQR